MKYAVQNTGWFIIGMLLTSAATQTFDVWRMVFGAAYFFTSMVFFMHVARLFIKH